MPKLLTAYNQPEEVQLTFGKGENHRVDETAVPEGYARLASNVDATPSNTLVSRPAFSKGLLPGGHSMYTSAAGDTFYVSNHTLVRVLGDSTVPVFDRMGSAVLFRSTAPLWWTELDGVVFYSNGTDIGSIDRALRWRPVGIPNNAAYNAEFDADRHVMVVWVDDRGEESGAVQCDRGYGSLVNDGYALRLYVSEKGSGVFRRVPFDGGGVGATDEEDALLRALALAGAEGAPVTTAGLVPLPGCKYLTAFAGRLFGAVGSTLVYSNALRFGLYDPAYNALDVPGTITAVGAVSDGLFVGTDRGMWFLSGTDPDKAELILVSSLPVFADSQCYVDVSTFPESVGIAPGLQRGKLPVWVTPSGVAVGLPTGLVRVPQASAVVIPPLSSPRVAVLDRNGYTQLVVVVNSTLREAVGTAVDSLVTN